MDKELYINMAAVEDKHWWFQARRNIVATTLRRLDLPKNARLLDLGCGTGGNLEAFSKIGDVEGCEMEEEAIQIAVKRGVCPVSQGYLPDHVPFPPQSFDVVIMTDVLEHVEDHEGAVGRVMSLLKPGGYFLVTVPALQWLWTDRDTAHHHFRRYHKKPLGELLKNNGFNVKLLSYANFWLFPLVATMRIWNRIWKTPYKDDLRVPNRFINGTLRSIFQSDRHLLGRIPLPFGVSLIAVGQLPTGNESKQWIHTDANSD